MRVRFTADYNHRWPSNAATFYPAGYEGTVRRVVGEAAVAKGRATEIVGRGRPAGDGGLSFGGRRGSVAGTDDAHNVGRIVQPALDGADQ